MFLPHLQQKFCARQFEWFCGDLWTSICHLSIATIDFENFRRLETMIECVVLRDRDMPAV